MQAIQTRYLAPLRGASRIKARAEAGSITLAWDHRLNPDENHRAAAEALANKLGWHGKWFGGSLPNSGDMVFVCADLGDKPAFMISRKPEGGWKNDEIAAYEAAMAERQS